MHVFFFKLKIFLPYFLLTFSEKYQISTTFPFSWSSNKFPDLPGVETFLPLVFMTCKLTSFQMQLESVLNSLYQKQPSRSVIRKICSENMHTTNFIYRRTTMPKCNLLNSHSDMGVFPKDTSRWLLLLYSLTAK